MIMHSQVAFLAFFIQYMMYATFKNDMQNTTVVSFYPIVMYWNDPIGSYQGEEQVD